LFSYTRRTQIIFLHSTPQTRVFAATRAHAIFPAAPFSDSAAPKSGCGFSIPNPDSDFPIPITLASFEIPTSFPPGANQTAAPLSLKTKNGPSCFSAPQAGKFCSRGAWFHFPLREIARARFARALIFRLRARSARAARSAARARALRARCARARCARALRARSWR